MPVAEKRRTTAIMLGLSPEHPGGVTQVVQAWRGGGLADRVNLIEIHTGRWEDRRSLQILHGLRALAALAYALARGCGDVVYLHVSTGGSVARKLAASWICRLFRVPFVAQIHSGDFEAWISRSGIARRISRSLFSHAAATVVVSHRWASLPLRLGARRVEIISNALPEADRAAFGQVRRERQEGGARSPGDGPVLLYYGRWSPVKGLDRVAAALRLIPSTSYEVRLFGNGDRSWLERQFAEVPGRVTIGGWLDLHAKARELIGATVVLLPSRAEGFGQTMLDARAAGVPVIASAVGGVPDALAGHEPVKLIDDGDDGALAAALAQVVTGEWPPDGPAPPLPDDFRAELAAHRLAELLDEIAATRARPLS